MSDRNLTDQDIAALAGALSGSSAAAHLQAGKASMNDRLREGFQSKRQQREQAILGRISESKDIEARRYRRRDDIVKRDAIGDEYRAPTGNLTITDIEGGKVSLSDGSTVDVQALDRAEEGHWVPRINLMSFAAALIWPSGVGDVLGHPRPLARRRAGMVAA